MNLTINTGEIELTVNNDPTRVIRFNPEDVGFIESFFELIKEFEVKSDEFAHRLAQLQNSKEIAENGIPANATDTIQVIKEICSYMRGKIDEVFGDGTSDAAFGKANTLEMFQQFFTGITPYIDEARKKKLQKYLDDKVPAKRSKKAVMK